MLRRAAGVGPLRHQKAPHLELRVCFFCCASRPLRLSWHQATQKSAESEPNGSGNIMDAQLFLMWGFLCSFLGMSLYMMRQVGILQRDLDERAEELMDDHQIELQRRRRDPRRPPWPVLHKRVTEIREGKHTYDDLNLSWEQCKYYYPHDWLIPMEISQILKYTSAVFLRQYVPDPEQMRVDLITQLKMIRSGRMMTGSFDVLHLNRDTQEIIDSALSDLEAMSFSDTSSPPVVPTYTR